MHRVDFGCDVWPSQRPAVLPWPAWVGLGDPWDWASAFFKSAVKYRNKKGHTTASCPMFSQNPQGPEGSDGPTATPRSALDLVIRQ